MRVSYDELLNKFKIILMSRGFTEEMAEAVAAVFAGNSLDGVYSHGVNRFPRVVGYLDSGDIDPNADAECVLSMGAIERWGGHRGFGPLNAKRAMDRACELAKEYGIGICWSNTMPNMPAWGGKDNRIGNNPFVLAIPRTNGRHVVMDCAVSQFSYGKIEETRMKGQKLPVPGGYDTQGNLTADPAEIEASGRVFPMGY